LVELHSLLLERIAKAAVAVTVELVDLRDWKNRKLIFIIFNVILLKKEEGSYFGIGTFSLLFFGNCLVCVFSCFFTIYCING
jgi:hypothetical protein